MSKRQASKKRRQRRKRAHARQQQDKCAQKIAYRREITALHKAAELGRWYYRCPHCGMYHLTSSPR